MTTTMWAVVCQHEADDSENTAIIELHHTHFEATRRLPYLVNAYGNRLNVQEAKVTVLASDLHI